jgi:hypothetical protein
LAQSRRNRQAAKRFFRELLKGLRYSPRVLITDKLKSYAAAKREIMPGVEHRQHKGLNNRAEVSHPPTRQQERQMRRFKSPRQAQRFLAAMRRSTTCSAINVIGAPAPTTAHVVARHLRLGMRSSAPRLRPETPVTSSSIPNLHH